MSEELKNRLKMARSHLRLSQSQASKVWGIPLRSLQNWEIDKATPRGYALTQLNAMLDAVLVGKKIE